MLNMYRNTLGRRGLAVPMLTLVCRVLYHTSEMALENVRLSGMWADSYGSVFECVLVSCILIQICDTKFENLVQILNLQRNERTFKSSLCTSLPLRKATTTLRGDNNKVVKHLNPTGADPEYERLVIRLNTTGVDPELTGRKAPKDTIAVQDELGARNNVATREQLNRNIVAKREELQSENS